MKIRHEGQWIQAEEVIDSQGIVYEDIVEHNQQKEKRISNALRKRWKKSERERKERRR